MSFFDTYKDIGATGGQWLTSDEKKFLIENGVPFTITGIAEDDENEYGPRFVAFSVIPNPESGEDEEKKVGFPRGSGVSTRDNMLAQMKEYLDGGGEPVKVKLEKPGKAILLVAA